MGTKLCCVGAVGIEERLSAPRGTTGPIIKLVEVCQGEQDAGVPLLRMPRSRASARAPGGDRIVSRCFRYRTPTYETADPGCLCDFFRCRSRAVTSAYPSYGPFQVHYGTRGPRRSGRDGI